MHLLFKALRVLTHHTPRTLLVVLAPIVPTAPHLTLTSFARAAQNGSLTLLHLRLSEFVVERGARAVSHADVYHKLKRPDRFEWIRARPQLLLPKEDVEDPQSARPRCEPLRRRYKRATKVEHCCETWTWCDYLSNS